MALCREACCNAQARASLRAEREAEFAAYLAEREGKRVAAPVIAERADAADHDLTYAEAVKGHAVTK